MKIKFNSEQLKKIFIKYKHLCYVLLVLAFILGMAYGAYTAVNPAQDKKAASAGQTAVDSLNTTFNYKIINTIKTETAPTVISGPAGRNPFLPY